MALIAPVNGADAVDEERQRGAAAGQRVAVCVAERALTSVVLAPPSSSTRSVVPDGLENCSLPPNSALSWLTTEASPPEKSTPTTLSFGSAVALSSSGSAAGSSTRTMLTLCCVLVAVSV